MELRFMSAALAWAIFAISPATAAVPMEQVGALSCVASEAPKASAQAATHLECELMMRGEKVVRRRYSGTLRGAAGWLVDRGGVGFTFAVRAPTDDVVPRTVAGTYDTTPDHDFTIETQSPHLLYGGEANAVALELLAPRLSVVEPGTTLTLTPAD